MRRSAPLEPTTTAGHSAPAQPSVKLSVVVPPVPSAAGPITRRRALRGSSGDSFGGGGGGAASAERARRDADARAR